MVTIGQPVENFELPASGGENIGLAALKGKNVVLYFYPKDNTPGCTKEGQAFRDLHDAFVALNTVILGVSRDSVKTHENFIAKYAFPFDLLSDKEERLCNQFNVIREKKNYGRTYMGIERSTFVIDSQGVLVKEYRKVKVKDHAQEVLDFVKTL